MRRSHSVATVVLSVDWHPPESGQSHAAQLSADKMIRLLQRYSLATTWALHDPHASEVPDLLERAAVRHEVSLLAHPAWSGVQAGRRQFGEQLQLRMEGARDRGILVRSLALAAGQQLPHLDLVQKQPLTALRMDDSRTPRDRTGKPYAVRFGLWNVPASRTLPDPTRWHWSPVAMPLGMVRTLALSQSAHVVIDAEHAARPRSSPLRTIENVLRKLANAEQAGQLNVVTISQLVDQLASTPERTPTCSILRKAA